MQSYLWCNFFPQKIPVTPLCTLPFQNAGNLESPDLQYQVMKIRLPLMCLWVL